MQIQNSLVQRIHAENSHIEQPLTSPLAENLSLLARTSDGLLHPMEHGSSIGIQPDVQKILHAAFAAQREEILTQPSSSNNTRLAALDSLEKRDFQPAEGGLRIRLTGKGLGGSGSSDSDSDPAEDVRFWVSEVASWEVQIANAANTLYRAGFAVDGARRSGASPSDLNTLISARDECEKVLQTCQDNLKDAKYELRSAQQKLSRQ